MGRNNEVYKDISPHIRRRGFVFGGLAVLAGGGIALEAVLNYAHGHTETGALINYFTQYPEYKHFPSIKQTAYYPNLNSLPNNDMGENTTVTVYGQVVKGDSIADGYVEPTTIFSHYTQICPTDMLAIALNKLNLPILPIDRKKPKHVEFISVNGAIPGTTMDEIIDSVKEWNTELKKAQNPDGLPLNIYNDTVLSGGGNDLMKYFEDHKAELEALANFVVNPFKEVKNLGEFLGKLEIAQQFASQVKAKIEGISDKFEILLETTLVLNKIRPTIKIPHIFVTGVPDLGGAKDDNHQNIFDEAQSLIATTMSGHLNYGIVRAIKRVQARHPEVEILFEDIQDTGIPLRGIHPTEEGQLEIAKRRAERCIGVFSGEKMTFAEKFTRESVQIELPTAA